jgi:RHS repeat-associated protein
MTYTGGGSNSFQYNGLNLRTRKVDSAGTFHYVTDGVTPGSDVLKDGAAVYTPGVSERRGTTSKYFQGDHLGSTRAITNSSQTQTDTWIYDAFGRVMNRTGTSVAPFQFAGDWQYQSDADSGLMLLGHRYYDSETGRFISVDPIGDGDNWYAYCDNNPLINVDSLGLDIKIIGPKDFQEAMQKIIDKVRETNLGQQLLKPYDGAKAPRQLIITPGSAPRTMPRDPNPKGTDLITFPDPRKPLPHLEGGTKKKPKPFRPSPARVLGHELGHLAYPNPQKPKNPDDVDVGYENEIIRRYENPIARELGEPPRTSYDRF